MLALAVGAATRLNERFTDVVNKMKFCTLLTSCSPLSSRWRVGIFSEARTKLLVGVPPLSPNRLNLPIPWSDIYLSRTCSLQKTKLFASRATSPYHILAHNQRRWNWTTQTRNVSTPLAFLNWRLPSRREFRRCRFACPYLIFHNSDKSPKSFHPSLSHSSPNSALSGSVGIGRASSSLYRDWDMPSLRNLEISEVLPDLRSDVASRIETCTVEANWEDTEGIDEGYWRTFEL